MWQPADTAPTDTEILLCHDNHRAGIFLGSGFRSEVGGWFESDAQTRCKLEPTHWAPIPELPHEAECTRKIEAETERQFAAGLDTLTNRS